MSKVKIGIIGSRFQADCIAHSVRMMPEEGEVVAVASPSPRHHPTYPTANITHATKRPDSN